MRYPLTKKANSQRLSKIMSFDGQKAGQTLIDDLDKSRVEVWKDVYYEFHDLIEKDRIFSKLPNRVMIRAYYTRECANHFGHVSNFFKNLFVIPVLLFWKVFLVKFECLYYKKKYPEVSTLENVKGGDFDFLFILNTRDHIITALPVLERMNEMGKKILIVTFKEVYSKYIVDFNKLNNAKILLFEYELKSLSVNKYIGVLGESKSKFDTLESYKMDADIKRAIQSDASYVKLHLKEELIQYHFFKTIFDSFDLKGVISIVLTTGFGIAKERGIPTFILQHGIGGGGHHPHISDYIIAYDDPTKYDLDNWADGTVTVLPLGAPRFEYLAEAAKKLKRDDFNTRLGKPVDARNVTFISGGAKAFENRELFLALKTLRQTMPDEANFILKLHPREIFNLKKEIKKIFSMEELEKTIFIKKGIDFYEILVNSDVVISTESTGLLEAIAMDVPVIQVNFSDQSYTKQCDLSTFGGSKPIDNADILTKEVLAIIGKDEKREEMVERQILLKNKLFKNFGKCSEIVAKTIIEKSIKPNHD